MSHPNGVQSALSNGRSLSIPPGVLQKALALAKPVQASEEHLLVQHIVDALRRGEYSYKKILNGLHGNKHSASIWKDYYLDHKTRIDAVVQLQMHQTKENSQATTTSQQQNGGKVPVPSIKKPTIPAVRKPSPKSLKHESPGPISLPLASTTKSRKRSHSIAASTPKEQRNAHITAISASGSGRATLNSLTAPVAVFDSRFPAPHTEIKIPELPSREPTPPLNIVPSTGLGRNKFTVEDHDFFIKFIQWRLLQDPDLSRKDLCDQITAKAPHHTSASWYSYWSNHHDLPDKILNAANYRLWPYGPKEHDDDLQGEPSPIADAGRHESGYKRPNYRDPSSSEDEEHSREERHSDESDYDDDESSDSEPVQRYSESEMSLKKYDPFNEADMYVVAKYIAGLPDWESTANRWEPFGEKYPQRSAKSWQEYFRRNQRQINRLVKRIEREETSQRVRPSGAPPRKKRRSESP